MQDWQSHTQVKTTSTGTGDLVLEATGVTADWQAFTALLDGKEVDVEIEHMTAEFEVEVGRFLYDHSPTPTLLRSLGGTEWSTSGVGVAHSFSAGDKLVSITVNGRTLRDLVLFRGSGITLREDTEFGAGATFPLVITDPLHRTVRITGLDGAALTQAMTVSLPDPANAEWGDEIYVEKIDTSTLTVTVFGFGSPATATHLLRRQGQFIVAKIVGPTTKQWVPQAGAQKSPSAKAQDIIRATNPEDQLVTGGAAKIRNATATQDGLATAAIAAVSIVTDAATFVPTAVDLSSTKEYDPLTLPASNTAFALAAVTEVPGAYITVQLTGVTGSTLTWSADFAEIQGANLTLGDYAGFTGSRRLVIIWSAAQGKALVALSGESSAAALPLAGGTMTGLLILAGIMQDDPDYIHSSAGAFAPDLGSGAVAGGVVSVRANLTSFAPTNPPATTSLKYPVNFLFVRHATGVGASFDLSGEDWGNVGPPLLGNTDGDWLEIQWLWRRGNRYPRYVDHRTA